MAGPLDGYRVVELAEGVAGPYCTMELGDAGADVIKIESLSGDCARGWGPPQEGGTSSVFLRLNRNKRSIALDLDSTEGIAIACRILSSADVAVVDVNRLPDPSFRYEQVAESNPQLVYCAISGFGDRGPWADRPSGELPVQLMSEATSSLGRTGEPPVRAGTDIASMYAAIHGVQGICAALLARDRIGSGQRLDVSLFGSLLAMRSTLWVAL
ncbi:MAG TPA: CoA transferase, partial [Dehalococcoidia bacterium]|nr:CoA transferase [Dehalococcoidia bacterium]